MKTRGKTLLILGCMLVLLGVGTIGVLAYFTDVDAVTNTFTVGNVDIELDEADVKPDGTLDTGDRVVGNEYHLIPGHTYIKDPTVTVKKGSEDSYVRMLVKVENIDKLKQAMNRTDYPEFYNGDLFLLQNLCVDKNGDSTWNNTKWVFKKFYMEDMDNGCYEFRYKTTVKDNSGPKQDGVLEPLFSEITVPGKIDNESLAELKDVKIIISAHAIQADGFDSEDKAWAAFEGQPSTN